MAIIEDKLVISLDEDFLIALKSLDWINGGVIKFSHHVVFSKLDIFLEGFKRYEVSSDTSEELANQRPFIEFKLLRHNEIDAELRLPEASQPLVLLPFNRPAETTGVYGPEPPETSDPDTGKLIFWFAENVRVTTKSRNWVKGGCVNFNYRMDFRWLSIYAKGIPQFEVLSEGWCDPPIPAMTFTMLGPGEPKPWRRGYSRTIQLVPPGTEIATGIPIDPSPFTFGANFSSSSRTLQLTIDPTSASTSNAGRSRGKKYKPFSFKERYLSEIFALLMRTPGFRLPPPNPPQTATKNPYFCPYHRERGHKLQDCTTFKLWLEQSLLDRTICLPKEYMKTGK